MEIVKRNNCKILSYNKAFKDDDDKLKVKLKVQHDNDNPNGSSFSLESIIRAKPTLINRPIVAFLVYNEGGSYVEDFAGHEVDFKNGKWVYKEQIIGIVPETMNYSIEKGEDGLSYPVVDGIIFKSYSNGAWKLIDDEDWDISMEIKVNDCFIRNDGVTEITDFSYRGLTILGKNFTPAMVNANVSSYSKEDYESTINKFNELLKEKEENELETTENVEVVEEVIDVVEPVVEDLEEKVDGTVEQETVENVANDEFEQLQEKYSSVCKELNTLQTQYDELEGKFNAMEDYAELKAFKENYDKAKYEKEVEEITNKFDLTEEEIIELKEKVINKEFTLEQYEEKLYCIIGKKQVESKQKFSNSGQKTAEVEVFDGNKIEKYEPYGQYKKYLNK